MQETYVAVGNEEFKEFAQILKRIEETNIFPYALKADNFINVGESLFRKDDDQLIKIFHEQGRWQYSNLKNSHDRGSLVQFIANRWATEKPIINKDPGIIFLAAVVANNYHRLYLKELKSQHKEKPEFLGSTSAPRMRR